MEIILEALIAVFGYILQFIFEIFAQAIFEVLAELGIRCLAEPLQRNKPVVPFLAATGYLMYGTIAGAISLLIPKMFVVSVALRNANLVVTPVACGFLMAWLGRFRRKRGDETIRLDTFMYGYLFALAMASVRYVWR